MTKILYNAKIAEGVSIGHFSIIGKPDRVRQKSNFENITELNENEPQEVIVSEGCFIDANVVIEEGVTIGPNSVIETGCIIESGTTIGANCYIVHGARILKETIISDNCVVGGFIADRSFIGEGSKVLGILLHKQDEPEKDWDQNIEMAPRVGKNVFVGVGAMIIGEIVIDDNVYICAGALVTKDIPSFNIVKGLNEIIPVSNWKGQLKHSLFWRK